MRLSHKIEYYALVSVSRLLCIIPKRCAFAIGSAVGSLGWALGIRKDLVLSNIANARPLADANELNRIGKQAARNFGRTVTEFIRYGIKDRDEVQDRVRLEGIEELENTLKTGDGAIILTGHYGSWAIYFAALSMAGIPLSLLVGKQHNEKVDKFIHKIPGDRVEFIPKGRTAIKVILEKLKQGRAVVMVADQHAGKGGLIVPFLGKNASTLPLPGSIGVKYNVPVFMMSGHRQEDGSHSVKIIALEKPESDTAEKQKIEIVSRYNIELGKIIAEKPEHYFWYHRRWREESETAKG